MQKKFAISFTRITPLNEELLFFFHENFLALKYSEERGYGFRHVDLSPQYLAATLVKRTPTLIPQLDAETGQVIKKEFFLFTEVEFAIDSKFHLIEIYGIAKNIPKLRASIMPLLPPNVELAPADLSPSAVIPKLLNYSHQISIEKLTVYNFQYRKGINGRFEMSIANSELARKIIDEYSHDVRKASIVISSEKFDTFFLDISDKSRLIVRCEENLFDDLYQSLKEILFR